MIFDNHMHIDERGLFLDAISMFEKAGGTHLILVHKPMYSTSLQSFREDFAKTIGYSALINEKFSVKSYPVVGMHPAEFDRLCEKKGVSEAEQLFVEVFEHAARLFEERLIVGIGEVGWPHYPAKEEFVEASKRMLCHVLRESARLSMPLQLHTESLDEEGFVRLARMMEDNGCPTKVVKHFCPPAVALCDRLGIYPSIVASEKNVRHALAEGRRFLLETDYIDERDRPGAVLGPKSVPKTTQKLLREGVLSEEDALFIHETLPREIYGIP